MEKVETMHKAFALVTPERFGASDWKEPVNAVVTGAELKSAGVTIEEVKEAIAFMTATEATSKAYILAGSIPGDIGLCFHVTAKGYRAGPAW